METRLCWTEQGIEHSAPWRNEARQKPPAAVLAQHEIGADALLKLAHANTAVLWRGDFHNAKQVLAAVKKRLHKTPAKKADKLSPAELFHRHRMQQAQQSRLINMLAVAIALGLQLELPRAPDVAAALFDVYGEENREPFLLPLNQLLGFIGAYEWHKKGVFIPALNGSIHVPFGVFSPLRGEYLDLLENAPLSPAWRRAFDIGTGSGVLAAMLARRGLGEIVATDNHPRALACARANFERFGITEKIRLVETDLFPEGKADLIVCNPPWLPATPTSAIEAALYDPGSAMLKGFLAGVREHLNENGEAWLILSDLAEHLELRSAQELVQWMDQAGLYVKERLAVRARHGKANHAEDALAPFRSRETTYLYHLQIK